MFVCSTARVHSLGLGFCINSIWFGIISWYTDFQPFLICRSVNMCQRVHLYFKWSFWKGSASCVRSTSRVWRRPVQWPEENKTSQIAKMNCRTCPGFVVWSSSVQCSMELPAIPVFQMLSGNCTICPLPSLEDRKRWADWVTPKKCWPNTTRVLPM
jgi:hypothetical protein